ncbi:MAG: hypothetical protein IVW57_16025, partial [Ktedonobacterales bacterium]|nr:hypothetical protein [Ktedonobacterales bacterium]
LYTDEELVTMGYTPLPSEKKAEVSALILQAAHTAYHTLDLGEFPGCRVVLDGRRALARAVVERHGMAYLTLGDGHAPTRQPVGVVR